MRFNISIRSVPIIMMLIFSIWLVAVVSGDSVPCGEPYPERCRCVRDSRQAIRTVNCSGSGVTEFPSMHSTVRTLDLSGNSIKLLNKADKIYLDLISLTLSDCDLEEISDDFLKMFPSVSFVNLRNNRLTKIPSMNCTHPIILDISDNDISKISPFLNPTLTALYLDHNKITSLKVGDLGNLPHLRVLTMTYNSIGSLDPDSLSPGISHLSLGNNQLTEFPLLNHLTSSLLTVSMEKNKLERFDNVLLYDKLENCTLANNKIESFPVAPSPLPSTSIRILVLTNNKIASVQREDFLPFPRLYSLLLSANELSTIPDDCFKPLQSLVKLDISRNYISEISGSSLSGVTHLETLYLTHNRLEHFPVSLRSMKSLYELDLTSNRLKEMPLFPSSLLLLYLAENQISSLNSAHFAPTTNIRDLDVSYNKIESIEVGVLECLPMLDRLQMKGNKLTSLRDVNFNQNSRLNFLDLSSNHIRDLPDNFLDKTMVTTAKLANNKITAITNETLSGVDGILQYLDLSYNHLRELSHVGLSAVETLYLDGNVKLVSHLPREGLNALKRVTVPFPVMCCWFKKIKKTSIPKEGAQGEPFKIKGFWVEEGPIDPKATFITSIDQRRDGTDKEPTTSYVTTEGVTVFSRDNEGSSPSSGTVVTMTTSYSPYVTSNVGGRDERDAQDVTLSTAPYTAPWGSTSQMRNPGSVEHVDFKDLGNATIMSLIPVVDELHCTPEPDEFNPCEDLIGNWVLRIGVWTVCTLAVVGNLSLFLVTFLSAKKFTPSRFLILNLSFSDFLTGVYLMMLAVVDARTYGFYEDYAMAWQSGPGCKIAGFLVTFSSELSMFTLTVISVERMVIIIHYSNPYKQLQTRHITSAMLIGWLLALTAAAMPMLGYSDYSLVAICLPFQNSSTQDMGLIMSLLVVNTAAVIIIIFSYLTIFCNVRHLQKPLDNADFRETLRISLIILTDVLCWLPIVVCGVSAAYGKPLITTSNAKILVVFFLPLNACANPFLYSLSRGGFKKDVLYVLSRVGLCQRAYYVTSRGKCGMDVDPKRKMDLVSDLRKPSQDSTTSSGYSSDTSYQKQMVSLLKFNIPSVEEAEP